MKFSSRPKPRSRHESPGDEDEGSVARASQTSIASIPPDGESVFLRLPPEIRHEIYRYLIPNDPKGVRFYTDIDTTMGGKQWSRRRHARPDRYSLAILRANHTIYQEALSVLYSENLFHFIGFNFLPVLDFIRRLSPEAREMIRRVRLTLWNERRQKNARVQPENYETFCKVIHDFLPGLNNLSADPFVWM
jgi:hypothetical protein